MMLKIYLVVLIASAISVTVSELIEAENDENINLTLLPIHRDDALTQWKNPQKEHHRHKKQMRRLSHSALFPNDQREIVASDKLDYSKRYADKKRLWSKRVTYLHQPRKAVKRALADDWGNSGLKANGAHPPDEAPAPIVEVHEITNDTRLKVLLSYVPYRRRKFKHFLYTVFVILFLLYLCSHANHTAVNVTESEVVPSTTPAFKEDKVGIPPKGAAEEEHHSSLTIFFILLVVAIAILVVHLLIQTKFHYLPDSIAIVLIGAFIGLLLKLFQFGNWKNEEAFPPNVFFIVLLPPIIFEGGYNLHKGNFFQNIGSILVFAVFGTVISAVVVGGGVYLLGQAEVAFKLDVVESFAFGSLISAVDPVATLAIFQALDVDPILYMLVFGESMLNDAVSIVLTTTLLEFASPSAVITSGTAAFFQAVGRFCLMFFASAAIGVAFGLVSAMLTKFLNLQKTPSLEVGMVFCFSYLPYALAEGIHLSGIMAILFCGIVMSHYTHLNLSPVSQITVQQTFRSIAFIAETCVFAYLGLAIFSFKVFVKPAFTIWSIVLILIGRAFNIFPLSFLMNFFREHKITRKNQFIMWFSGLRGAVAFALSLHMELKDDTHQVLITTTLIIVLFTIVFLGGSTMPLLKLLQTTDKKQKKKKKKYEGEVSMSKTKEMGDAIDSEHLSELTEEDETHVVRPHLKGFLKLDVRYLIPFFTKRFTQQEMREGRSQVDVLANQWEMEVRAAPSESDDENESMETSLIAGSNGHTVSNGSSSPSNRA